MHSKVESNQEEKYLNVKLRDDSINLLEIFKSVTSPNTTRDILVIKRAKD